MTDKIKAEIKRLMATGMTEKEARECAEYDARIDAGEKVEGDLTPEQQKVAKKYTNVDTKKQSAMRKAPERKPNESKRKIIKFLNKCLQTSKSQITDLNISNIERQIDFTYDGKSYSLTLTEHRPSKKK